MEAATNDAMAKWEYKTIMIAPDVGVEHMNRLGQEGWELVGTSVKDRVYSYLFFKRPLREDS